MLVEGRSAALLIDAGPSHPGGDAGRSVVLPALVRLGVRRLDVVLASHGDRDHRGGLPSVLRSMRVGELWLPYGGSEDPAFAEVIGAARDRGVRVVELGAGSARRTRGDVVVTPLWPPVARPGGARSDNARSLVVRVDLAGRSILLTGDLEREGERALLDRGAPLAADVLKLGHHGSRTSSHEAFLREVSPAWVVVSAPHRGRMGFPHPTVLERIRALGLGLAWTGRDGAVLIGLDDLALRGWASGSVSLPKRGGGSGGGTESLSSATPE